MNICRKFGERKGEFMPQAFGQRIKVRRQGLVGGWLKVPIGNSPLSQPGRPGSRKLLGARQGTSRGLISFVAGVDSVGDLISY